MRNNVAFNFPAEFIRVSEDDGVLSVNGANWFLCILDKIDNLAIQPSLIQEDWGVLIRAQRGSTRFWIGLSQWEDDDSWLAHMHLDSLLQKFSTTHKAQLRDLAADIHKALSLEPRASNISWYSESDMRNLPNLGAKEPNEA